MSSQVSASTSEATVKKPLGALITFPSRHIDAPADWQLTPPPPKKPRRRRKPPVSLSDAQLVALLTLARQYRVRDWVMILLTYWHGLRASETVHLRIRDFDLLQGTVRIVRGKGSDGGDQMLQEHENPLLNERVAVQWWLENRGQFGVKGGKKQIAANILQNTKIVKFSSTASTPPCVAADRVFQISRVRFWQLVHGYALAAGIPRAKAKSHMLKHTIAKHLIRSGLPINEVQAWLGWKSLETANWYLMADEDELGDRVGRAIRGKVGLRQVQQESLFS